MKSYFYLLLFLTLLSVGASAQPSRLNVDGVWYTNGQTAFIDCAKPFVYVFIDPIYGIDPATGQPAIAPIQTQQSPNFSVSDTQSDVEKKLNLDPNRQDGFVKASVNDFSPGNYIIVNIAQKVPIPILTGIPTLCSAGQNGTISAQATYALQSTQPANLVWRTAGGVTVNGSSTYTQTNSTNGTVTVQFSSRGALQAYLSIPGCNSLNGVSTQSVYFGTPQITDVTVNNTLNPGPYQVSSGSTNYVSIQSAFGYVPNYSLSTTTRYGNVTLSLSGSSGASCQIYAYGSSGNAALNIVASNSCGTDARDVIFYIAGSYRIAPNPARSDVTVSFDNPDDNYSLPDQLDLVSEKDGKIIKTVNVKEVAKQKAFKNGNEINFTIGELSRGTYYMRVLNNKQPKEKQVETTRLIFN